MKVVGVPEFMVPFTKPVALALRACAEAHYDRNVQSLAHKYSGHGGTVNGVLTIALLAFDLGYGHEEPYEYQVNVRTLDLLRKAAEARYMIPEGVRDEVDAFVASINRAYRAAVEECRKWEIEV